jgi:NAD(P)H-hydrate epimerase
MRLASGNKGTFGKVLIIAGSKNMAGAAYFSALAAMRSGAGMVKILTAESNRDILQREIPEALLETYTNDEDVVMALDASLAWADVVCMGPGLGTTERSAKIVRYVLLSCSHPLVLDADGLNCLFGDTTLLSSYMGKLYVTPHMGEMGRLARKSVAELKSDPISSAVFLARSCGVFTVMKDARTVIAQPDGSVYINVSGNSGMATAGSGDVLTGITAAMLALDFKDKKESALSRSALFFAWPECESGFAAAVSAVIIHAAAGDCARDHRGEHAMTAGDLIEELRSPSFWGS